MWHWQRKKYCIIKKYQSQALNLKPKVGGFIAHVIWKMYPKGLSSCYFMPRWWNFSQYIENGPHDDLEIIFHFQRYLGCIIIELEWERFPLPIVVNRDTTQLWCHCRIFHTFSNIIECFHQGEKEGGKWEIASIANESE